MTKYNPDKHHRRSVRLRNYDYSQARLYFVTICVKNGECLFGKIIDGKLILNELGEIVKNEWLKTTELRPNVQLHEFVVMPNHFHTIFEITHKIDNVEMYCTRPKNTVVGLVGAYCIRPNEIRPDENNANNTNNDGGVFNTPLRSPSQTVGAVIRGFKSAVSRQIGFSVWQRDMHEHIIRDRNAHARIAEYIVNNPINWEKDKFYVK